MLRDLVLHGRSRLQVLLERGLETVHITEASHGAKAAAGLMKRRADPTQHHLAIAPVLHGTRVMRDQAVEVLNRVRGSECPVERAIDTQTDQRERLLQAFAQAGSSPRMSLGERTGESFELSFGKRWIFALPGVAHCTTDTGMQLLG